MKSFVLLGNFIDTPESDKFRIRENSFMVVLDGKIEGFYQEIPEKYKGLEVADYNDYIIIPGLVDLHLHAPQFTLCGTNMDLELLPWLNSYVFPEEARFSDHNYSEKIYSLFVEELKKSATTRACIFATVHKDATIRLMELMEQSGLCSYVGKVNMDRNSAPELQENTDESIKKTEEFINEVSSRFERTKPIITPRFAPSCTAKLMKALGKIAEKYSLPVQSHLSENTNEIKWVQELFPDSSCYGDVYDSFSLFGKNQKTIMAHAVHCPEEELQLLKENGVYVAHCPQSNINLSSGISKIRKMLSLGILVGLGTDIAGGANISMIRAVTDAIQVSKLLSAEQKNPDLQITFPEAFNSATKIGGSFFGKVGVFDSGYELDALALSDKNLYHSKDEELKQRLERIFYLGNENCIAAKYVQGRKIF